MYNQKRITISVRVSLVQINEQRPVFYLVLGKFIINRFFFTSWQSFLQHFYSPLLYFVYALKHGFVQQVCLFRVQVTVPSGPFDWINLPRLYRCVVLRSCAVITHMQLSLKMIQRIHHERTMVQRCFVWIFGQFSIVLFVLCARIRLK